MESLATESLARILQHLSPIDRLRAEQVCKKWRDVSRRTWRDIQMLHIVPDAFNIYYHTFKNCTEPRDYVKKKGNELFIGCHSLKIIGCLISRVGCFIEKLIISYHNPQEILSMVSHYCHNLKALELQEIYERDEILFSKLFEGNKQLHSVACAYSRSFIEALPLRNWRSLRSMSREPVELWEEKIISLLENSHDLEEFQSNEFTTRIVEALVKLPNLKSLYITPYDTELSIEKIFHVPLLNQLKNLVIGHIKVEGELLCNVLQHCSQLRRLDVTWDDYNVDVLLEAILALPNLETLGLICAGIDDDTLIHLTKFKNLWIEDQEYYATDDGIFQMIKNSEVLEKLNIRRTDVTPEMFKRLVGELNNRQKYLEVFVNFDIFDEASEICAGSKIRLATDLHSFMESY